MLGRRFFGNRSDDLAATALETEPRSSLLDEALAVLEAGALAVYREHGLPDRPGQYSCSPGATEWTWLAENLSPAQKWALVEEQPPGDGWRYSDLNGIGASSSIPRVDIASQVLTGCAALRGRFGQGERPDADDMAAAIQLGALAALIIPVPELPWTWALKPYSRPTPVVRITSARSSGIPSPFSDEVTTTAG